MGRHSIQSRPRPGLDTSALLYQVANEVTISIAANLKFSSFHIWDKVERLGINNSNVQDDFWDDLFPYLDCLGLALHAQRSLREALSQKPETAQYADLVQLMTNTKMASQTLRFHSFVALCFHEYCIAIDLPYHASAFEVKLEGSFTCEEVVSLHGKTLHMYHNVGCVDWSRKLTMDRIPFSEMDSGAALRQLAIPSLTPSIGTPQNKYVIVRSLLDSKPEHLVSTPFQGKYLAITCRLRVDFENSTLILQVPLHDWLLKPEQKERFELVNQSDIQYSPWGKGQAHLELKLYEHSDEANTGIRWDLVDVLAGIATTQGLPVEEVHRAVEAIQRVRNGVRAKSAAVDQ